jgi:hypothetical protein
MFLGNPLISMAEHAAGEMRIIAAVHCGRGCGRGSEKVGRELDARCLRRYLGDQYSQVFCRKHQSGARGNPEGIGGNTRFHQNRPGLVQIRVDRLIFGMRRSSGDLAFVSDLERAIHQLSLTFLKVCPIFKAEMQRRTTILALLALKPYTSVCSVAHWMR